MSVCTCTSARVCSPKNECVECRALLSRGLQFVMSSILEAWQKLDDLKIGCFKASLLAALRC